MYFDNRVWGEMVVFDIEKYKVAKIIETVGNTSIQLHPNSDEVWYILDKYSDDAVIGIGDSIEDFQWVNVNVGDVIYIPKYKIHCLGAGLKVLELKECEDVTVRLYDWGRVRE